MNHYDELTCLLYLEGQLDRKRALELSAHAEACESCRTLLRALEQESRLLENALTETDEAVPARLTSLPGKKSTSSWGWLAAFGLASAGAYTLWTEYVEPWYRQFDQVNLGGTSWLYLFVSQAPFWKGWGEMRDATQLLAMVTVAIVGFFFLRRTWRRLGTLGVVLGCLAAALSLPMPTAAAEVKKTQQSYTLPAGQTIDNDLLLFAGTGRIDGNVNGDLIFFGQSLTVNGNVSGDVLAFGQNIRVNGPVQGNVRCFCSMISLSGAVSRNVTAFTGNFEFDSKAEVSSMMLFAGESNLGGRVRRDLMAFSGKVNLDGAIGGSAMFHVDRLSIGPSAAIAGKAKYRGARQPEVSPEAKLASPLEIQIVKRRPDYLSLRYYWRQLLRTVAAFLLGAAVLLLLPAFYAEASRGARRYGPALGFGLLALVATPILGIIACITIVGLALGLVGIILWVVALYTSQVFVGAWAGETLLGPASGTAQKLARLALGLLVVRVGIMLPFVGGFLTFVVIVWGLGAMTLALIKRTGPGAETPVPAPVTV